MSALRFILASLRHYRRTHLAVLLGVAVATAVLTGALLVGDSVNGSLRDLTLQRLGRIDTAIVSSHLFREKLADEVLVGSEFQEIFASAQPAILLTGTIQMGTGQQLRTATDVSVTGIRPEFWALGVGGPAKELSSDQIAITRALADELKAGEGDAVLLRLPIVSAIPADSPLGEKSETSNSKRFTIAEILPDEGLSRFSLFPSQHLARNAFIPLSALQSMLDRPARANVVLLSTKDAGNATSEAAQQSLRDTLKPTAEDLGMRVESVTTPASYVGISSDELVLPDAVVSTAQKTLGNTVQPVSTYLANTIVVGTGDSQRKIPYSTVAGVDSIAGIGPLLDEAGQPIALADDEIVLNQWAADSLEAKVGDTITLNFYEPESTHGELRQRTPAPIFKLRAIVPLETADGKPTAAADPKLTPELPGVTDQSSIRDWELPFELVETIRDEDEDYWDRYHTTPKAFVSLATAQRLWPSRWGSIGVLRIPGAQPESAAPEFAAKLAAAIDPTDAGIVILPVKQQGLLAASGTTPFGLLFLGFSFFLIAAALMLISLLFQLGVEQRSRELGALAALGIDRWHITKLLSREGLLIAALGATLGILGGILYAWLMIAGLRTWWLAAISTPFLALHINWLSLLLGWLAGVALAWLTIRWSIRRLTRQSPVRLLAGGNDSASVPSGRSDTAYRWALIRMGLAVVIVVLLFAGYKLQGEAQAGSFFGSGAAALALLLGEIRYRLRRAGRTTAVASSFSLPRLAWLNAARNPGRSTLTIGLVAAASFLIVAISAFRLETTDAGTGGFEYIATSDRPLHYDLNTEDGRVELGLGSRVTDVLDQYHVYSLRVSDGEDASCLNLYRPTQPRVLGVPLDFVKRGGFQWAAVRRSQHSDPVRTMRDTVGVIDAPNPWTELNQSLGSDDSGRPIIPVVLDAATAMYSLHLAGVGSRFPIRDAADRAVTLEVVGLLKNSVLQGNLLISEEHFLRLFPDTGGYRFFLVERLAQGQQAVSTTDLPAALESALASDGFDVVDARQKLAGFLAVQNTYLSTFQSLGALGLLLGTAGLAVVQLRSVIERRGEFALMRASGFSTSRLLKMVMLENTVLLLGGLFVGTVAAGIALIPQWLPREASVPWLSLSMLLLTIALVGLLAAWATTRTAVKAPILPALRGD